jgi:hypothetical protein
MRIGIVGFNADFIEIPDKINFPTEVGGISKIAGGVINILPADTIGLSGVFNGVFQVFIKYAGHKMTA